MSEGNSAVDARGNGTRTWLVVAAAVIIFAGALAFRVPALGMRPMHGDEANQALKSAILLEKGEYAYDPFEHHGPTLYYLFLPVAWLTGVDSFADSEAWHYRIVPVMFGAALVLLLLLVLDGLGRWPVVWAALLTAISPPMVFFSRYYVQEMLLVFFTFALIATGWRYAQSRRVVWAVLAGVSAGLMHATKETSAVAFIAMAGALLFSLAFALRRGATTGQERRKPSSWHAAAFVIAAGVISIVFFSSFFTHPHGLIDEWRAYWLYIDRAGGEGSTAMHEKPWWYYFHILGYIRTSSGTWWSEGLTLFFALIGIVVAITRRTAADPRAPFLRFLAVFAILITLLYAIIPYKTPWLVITFLHPLILLAGVGIAATFRGMRRWWLQVPAALIVLALAAQLGWQSYRANYEVYSDHRNPWVYAHPVIAIDRLRQRMEDLAAVSPDGRSMLIYVIKPDGDYWPLPWYLRHFDRVGYWHQPPETADASVVITGADLDLSPLMKRDYIEEYYNLRPGVMLRVQIDAELWERFMETRR